jgi:hypothetical protein
MRIRETYKQRFSRIPDADALWRGGKAFLGSGATLESRELSTDKTTPPETTSASCLHSFGWISLAVRWTRRGRTF